MFVNNMSFIYKSPQFQNVLVISLISAYGDPLVAGFAWQSCWRCLLSSQFDLGYGMTSGLLRPRDWLQRKKQRRVAVKYLGDEPGCQSFLA